jgi:pSer/pThr/pTyr-binding forkhead associated (FHA) protein
MQRSPLARHGATPAELKERLEAEARGVPFLLFRDGDGAQRILELTGERDELTVGRREDNDIVLNWDGIVSRLHAQVVRVGRDWTVADDGLSQNGTFVNDVRVSGRRRLRHGDLIRFGSTAVAFVAPALSAAGTTAIAQEVRVAAHIPPAQKRVLVALCRPLATGSPLASPATNQEIADELYLSIDAVKTHLRGLYRAFEIEELPQQHKRGQLAQRALLAGIVTDADLEGA